MSRAALLEIGVEDIPASYFDFILSDLEARARESLASARLDYEVLRCFAAPRRLAVLVEGIADRQRPEQRAVKGPPRQVAFDAEGKPTQAALAFARAQNVPVEALQVRSEERGEYLYALRLDQGLETAAVLGEVWERLIASLSFPKFMRWGEGKMRFVRPIRWLVALLDAQVIPLEVNGVRSGRRTMGHRTLAPGPLEIPSAIDYEEVLERGQVIVDQRKRVALVEETARQLAASLGGEPYGPDRLAEQVAYMTEHPYGFVGTFAEEFLTLPMPVLATAMRKHQWYFAVLRDGQPLPYFIAFRDGAAEGLDVVRRGNERALRGRLADASFFYAEDRARPLEAYVGELRKIAFAQGLDSLFEKAKRLETLVEVLGQRAGLGAEAVAAARRAAYLCKADLVTRMVVEFPSLQGLMGEHYARLAGEPEAVAAAIGQHYRPQTADDSPPASVEGALVSLADRADLLCAFLAGGVTPTGSEDPYGLRRAAHGIAAILMSGIVRLPVGALLSESLALLVEEFQLECHQEEVLAKAADLVRSRVEFLLEQSGYQHDIVEAAMAEPWHDLCVVSWRAQALAALRAAGALGELALAATRAINILRSAEARAVLEDPASPALDAGLLALEAEQALYAACLTAEERLQGVSDWRQVLEALRPLVQPIHRFFDDVLVMDSEVGVRINRIRLLERVAACFARLGDLSKIPT